tara:strand:- start:15674 stop:16264 length:591 start_codon:yes stop_codon:yes gene_type:complete
MLLLFRKNPTSVPKAFNNAVISFIASCGYLLPIRENIKFYGEPLKEIPYLEYLVVPFFEPSIDAPMKLIPDPSEISILMESYGHYISVFIFFMVYYIFIKNRKKLKIDYFISYNVMHAVLISLIQAPLTFIYIECVQYLTLNKLLKLWLYDFGEAIIIFNFFMIFYCLFYAATNRYVDIPTITPNVLLHLGKKPTK